LRDYTAECGPTPLIHGKGNYLFAVSDKMGPQDGAHACGGTGALELDCAVDSVGIGAGQRSETALGRRLGEHLGTGDAEAEGEVGVNVEVGKHLFSKV
jgi:hypothetical protein